MDTEYRWTDGNDADFRRFYLETEAYYNSLVGGEENRKAFVPFNLSGDVPHVVIAVLDGTAVGCAGLKPYSACDAEIKRVWVEAACRGRGIAGGMLDRIEKRAKEMGFKRTVLQTRQVMEDAVGLYLGRGYRRIENYPPYDAMPEAVCFAKEL